MGQAGQDGEESGRKQRESIYQGNLGLERSEFMRFLCGDLHSLDKVGGRDVQSEFLILD